MGGKNHFLVQFGSVFVIYFTLSLTEKHSNVLNCNKLLLNGALPWSGSNAGNIG